MKILVFIAPYYSHIVNVKKITDELEKRNHDLTYIYPYEKADIFGDNSKILGYNYSEKIYDNVVEAIRIIENTIDEFDLLLYDEKLFLGKTIAEEHNKLAIRVATTFAYNKEITDEYVELNGGRIFWWTYVKATKKMVGNHKLKTDCLLSEYYINPPKLTIVCIPKELQPLNETFSNDLYKFVGDFFANEENEHYEIDGNRPIIYISLGSILSTDKMAQQRYQIFFDAFRNEAVTVIMSADETMFDENMIPDNFTVKKWLPQMSVLAQADLFITHGGMNSVMESIVQETPMCVVPCVNDQMQNGQMVEKLGLGCKLDFMSIDAIEVREIAYKIMKDKNVKVELHNMKEKMNRSMGVIDAADIIEDFCRNEK